MEGENNAVPANELQSIMNYYIFEFRRNIESKSKIIYDYLNKMIEENESIISKCNNIILIINVILDLFIYSYRISRRA